MKIAIIGAGAMGCLFACLLDNYEVTLYDVSPVAVERISRDGILLQEPDGTESRHRIPIRFSGEGQEPQDLVILFVKDTAGEAALRANLGLVGKDTVLLSLQNGMGNFEIMQRYVPAERILLGTTRHNCVTRAPGVVYHSGAGRNADRLTDRRFRNGRSNCRRTVLGCVRGSRLPGRQAPAVGKTDAKHDGESHDRTSGFHPRLRRGESACAEHHPDAGC